MTTTTHYLEAELEALLEREPSIWKFLQESAIEGVWYWDLEDPVNEYLSPDFWRLFGYDPATKEHLSAEWQNVIHASRCGHAVSE